MFEKLNKNGSVDRKKDENLIIKVTGNVTSFLSNFILFFPFEEMLFGKDTFKSRCTIFPLYLLLM
jgi:hypothetical protein